MSEIGELESELRFALDAARFGAWSMDLIRGELTTSATCREIFGRDPAAPFTFRDLRDCIHPDDRERQRQANIDSLATGADFDIDYRVITPTGEIRWISNRGQAFHDAQGKAVRMAGISVDVTHRRALEARRAALVSLSDCIRDMEDPAELAYAAAQIIGATLDACRVAFGHADRAAQTLTIERDWCAPGVVSRTGVRHFRDHEARVSALAGGGTVIVEDIAQSPGAAPKAEILLASGVRSLVNMPIRDQGGVVAVLFMNSAEPRAWAADDLAFAREVAERTLTAIARRRAERALRDLAANLEKQVEARTAELVQAQDALRQAQKLEAMGQLTGGVAHDFNNLLTPIIGSLDMLQRKGLGGEREQRLIDGALQSAERAQVLVQRLLAFARRQPLRPEPVDVAALIGGMAQLIASTSGPQIKVRVEAEDDLPPALADANQLEMALLNLSVNARDAMPDGGALTLSLALDTVAAGHRANLAAGDYLRLSVADTGEGMDPDTVLRAVEPFFSTKGVGKGTGLGLSMVHGLASQLGGGLAIASRRGLGTLVELWLPACERQAGSPIAEPRAPGLATSAGAVLLVDDEPLVRASTADMLGDLGYSVTQAESAHQALSLLDAGAKIDLLVTDHLMPGMTGTELARAVRERWPHQRLLIISGFAEAEGLAADLPLLAKPFRQADLAASLAGLKAAG
ncbi:signal transduction histidine kinase/CheY-like chemotaxis protein [Caulobacter ginsengisoli]|uniref:histidine kinase n=1 Tax=Caulobacter ginsengisoli TaxID=400775 RepID=A0ABU0IWT7_9CAUL|nr:PAS domain-containing protein [Caulobacter ginsengisoli]MDQ0466488.1 signal transduction histidine kinase/CheY-like chemotaxis protein [Caulobacter ginsengisoli]